MLKIAKISRMNAYEKYESDKIPEWLEEFVQKEASKETKTIVDVGRERAADISYQSISSILNMKNTVEGRIQELQDQLGMNRSIRADVVQTGKVSEADDSLFPNLPEHVVNNLISFIMNKIAAHKGFIDLPAIKDNIAMLFSDEGVKYSDVDTPAVDKFIFDLIQEYKHDMPNAYHNLGKVDPTDLSEAISDNNDFFRNFTPTRF